MAVTLKMLAKMHYFSGLTQDELKEVKKYIAAEKQIEKGQTLLLEDDQSDYMYFITSGSVKVLRSQLTARNRF